MKIGAGERCRYLRVIRRGKRRRRGRGITDWRGEVVDEHVCDEGQGGERERGEGAGNEEEGEEEEQAVLAEEKEGALHEEFRAHERRVGAFGFTKYINF